MPDRPHHSEKWHRCVEQVQEKGHPMASAAAICTRALEDAGEDIYASATIANTPFVWNGEGTIGKPFKLRDEDAAHAKAWETRGRKNESGGHGVAKSGVEKIIGAPFSKGEVLGGIRSQTASLPGGGEAARQIDTFLKEHGWSIEYKGPTQVEYQHPDKQHAIVVHGKKGQEHSVEHIDRAASRLSTWKVPASTRPNPFDENSQDLRDEAEAHAKAWETRGRKGPSGAANKSRSNENQSQNPAPSGDITKPPLGSMTPSERRRYVIETAGPDAFKDGTPENDAWKSVGQESDANIVKPNYHKQALEQMGWQRSKGAPKEYRERFTDNFVASWAHRFEKLTGKKTAGMEGSVLHGQTEADKWKRYEQMHGTKAMLAKKKKEGA